MNKLEVKENIKIENMIYEVREKQVMLNTDADLKIAKIMGDTGASKSIEEII